MIKIIKDLIKVAKYEIKHDYQGFCPDDIDITQTLDPECKACQIIMEAERYLASCLRES